MCWVHLAQHRDQWQVLVCMALNTQDAQKGKELVEMLSNFLCLRDDCAVWSYEDSFYVFLYICIQIVLTIQTD